MRIGIDARLYGGEEAKGLGRYTEKLLEYLAENDKKNDYVIFVKPEVLRHFPIKAKNFKLVSAAWRWYSFAEQIFMPFKIWWQKLDLMHFPHFNVPLFYRGKFVVTIHDLILTHFPTERATTLGPFLYKIKHFGYKLTIKHAVKNSKKIITVSEYSKDDLIREFSTPAEKIEVTYEAVDVIEEEKNKIRKNNFIAKLPKKFLLYVGNAYPHKNLEILIDVVKEAKKSKILDFKLVFVGKDDYFYHRLKDSVWKKSLDKEIIFLGFVPDELLPVIYEKAFAYIFPSKYEGFGLPALEAMAYGTPVISSNKSCLPEVLGEAALYFDPNDLYGIISAIEKVQETKLQKFLIKQGYVQIKKYSWEAMAKQTLKIYESAKNKNKG